MSHLSRIFEEAPIRVQNRNGFDLSHVHSGSSKTGQLVPVLTKLIAPNSTISLGVDAEVSLPPIVAPFYGKIDFAIEGFIVPCSILYGGWKQFISNNEAAQFSSDQISGGVFDDAIANADGDIDNNRVYTGSNSGNGLPSIAQFGNKGYAIPQFEINDIVINNRANFDTLMTTNDNIYDYMGCSPTQSWTATTNNKINLSLMPALAYHKICDVFYRNTKLTNTWFAVNPNTAYATGLNAKNVSLAWHSFYTDGTDTQAVSGTSGAVFNTSASLTFPDGVSVFSTRQRTYSRDYFTSAVGSPQQGAAATLHLTTAGSGEGQFTINSLRMANSLQKFLETNNLSGDYADMVRNRWGIRPIDADFEEPHYLGRVVIPVYQHTVVNNSTATGTPISASSNPYVADSILGSKASTAGANGEGSICENFNVSCWSYLMCIASLYPHAQYNYGLNRELTMTKLGDYPAPELQGVGMEEIKNYEIAFNHNTGTSWNGTFGYIPRYSRFKYVDDFSSGELRPSKTLAQFQIQRSFGNTVPQLGTNFVTIPQNALDNVLAVTTATMNLSCWWEIYFKLKVVMPLADFCIPTLGELQDTHTIKSTVGGSRL